MEFLFYLIIIIALPFILLQWIYEKIIVLYHWLIDEPEPRNQHRKQEQETAQGDSLQTEAQDKTLLPEIDQKPKSDNGMNPQERAIPYITPEPKKPEPVKKKPPKIVFEFPKKKLPKTKGKKNGKERQGMEI